MRRWIVSILTTILTLNGCVNEKIVNDNNSTVPQYKLRTRLVIQNFPNVNTPCITYDEVARQLALAEFFFKKLGIQFDIEAVERWDFKQSLSVNEIKKDAADYPDYISFYYITILSDANRYIDISTNSIGFLSGLSAFPWESNPYAVILFPQAYTPNTTQHELGHYFGLYHTFEDFGDKVDDTEEGKDPSTVS